VPGSWLYRVVRLDDLERAYWMGTEVGLLGGYGFQGVTLGVDGSCKDGKMGSGCCKFREEGAGKCARVGREEEGTSSKRPELGGVVLELQSAALSEDVLLLCDNEAFLCAIKKWVGHGGKTKFATATDTDILREIVCLLTQRVRAGRATFLIKVKSHRGEPINERADTLAEEGREISDDAMTGLIGGMTGLIGCRFLSGPLPVAKNVSLPVCSRNLSHLCF
jgi:ribonuclease HI